jgi:hypothetical protein
MEYYNYEFIMLKKSLQSTLQTIENEENIVKLKERLLQEDDPIRVGYILRKIESCNDSISIQKELYPLKYNK